MLGLGGLVAISLLVLGILFFGGDIKAALIPVEATLTSTPTQLTDATFISMVSPEITSIATPPIDSEGIRLADGMQMVYVPEGAFTMGSDEGEENEKPAHQVYLDAYWIDQTEVSNAMYGLCVSKGVCQWSSSYKSYTQRYWDSPILLSDRPVIYVDWNSAKTYCEWAGVRLPNEAEWEKAARGTDGRLYPWGNQSPDRSRCNFNNQAGGATPVGRYSPAGDSPYGCADMAGNVWEWTGSLPRPYPYDPLDGREDPAARGNRVLRGGGWSNVANLVRAAYRFRYDPNLWSAYYGFRCACSA